MYMWVNAWLFKVSCSVLGTIFWRYIFKIFLVQDVSHIFSILTRWKIICHTSNGQKGMCICLNTRWNKSEPIILERIYLPKFWPKHNPKKKKNPPLLYSNQAYVLPWGIWSWIGVSAVIQVWDRRTKDKFELSVTQGNLPSVYLMTPRRFVHQDHFVLFCL